MMEILSTDYSKRSQIKIEIVKSFASITGGFSTVQSHLVSG